MIENIPFWGTLIQEVSAMFRRKNTIQVVSNFVSSCPKSPVALSFTFSKFLLSMWRTEKRMSPAWWTTLFLSKKMRDFHHRQLQEKTIHSSWNASTIGYETAHQKCKRPLRSVPPHHLDMQPPRLGSTDAYTPMPVVGSEEWGAFVLLRVDACNIYTIIYYQYVCLYIKGLRHKMQQRHTQHKILLHFMLQHVKVL